MSDNSGVINSGPGSVTVSGSAIGRRSRVHNQHSAQAVPRGGPATDTAEPLDRRVFVVHGRDEQARKAMFEFLRSLDLQPLDWESLAKLTGQAAPHVLEVVRLGFAKASAVVVLLTPDDIAYLHPLLRRSDDLPHESMPCGQPRANVLLEAGMALALHPSRTVLVEIGKTRGLSDLAGLDFVQMDGSPAKLNNIVQRLERAGCRVDVSGTGWLEPARFSGLEAFSRQAG